MAEKFSEKEFQNWYKTKVQGLGLDPNPDAKGHYYDYRAAYKAGAEPDKTGHWPSKYKREGHPNLYIDGVDTRTGKNKPILSDSPIERAVLWEAEQIKERVKKAYAILSEPLTEERVKKPVTSEEVSQAANIAAGFIPGVPDNALKALLTMHPRIGKVLKVQKKEDYATIFNKAIKEVGGEELTEIELKDLMEHSLGAQFKGIRALNIESIARSVQEDMPVNASILDRLIAISKETKKVARHERGHTATLPIVRFTATLQLTPDVRLAPAAKTIK